MQTIRAKYQVYGSAVLDAPIEEVWALVRDMMQMIPIVFGEAVKEYRWLDGSSGETIPARFEFTLNPSGAKASEEVYARSEREHSLSYRLIGTALGIEGYAATYRLSPITNSPGKTFLEWPREFSVAPGEDPEKVAPMIAGLADNEVAAVQAYFAKRKSAS